MNLEDTLDILPGDSVYVTKNSKDYGDQYARALVNPLDTDRPYPVLRMDTFTHSEGTENDNHEVVDRANLYLKEFPGTRFNPINFIKFKE